MLIKEIKERFNFPNTNPRWYLDDDKNTVQISLPE